MPQNMWILLNLFLYFPIPFKYINRTLYFISDFLISITVLFIYPVWFLAFLKSLLPYFLFSRPLYVYFYVVFDIFFTIFSQKILVFYSVLIHPLVRLKETGTGMLGGSKRGSHISLERSPLMLTNGHTSVDQLSH